MSIPSAFHSIFLSCNDEINMFVDTDSVSGSNPFLSGQPLEDPLSYHTLHAQRSIFVNSCSSGTPVNHNDLSNHPSLISTICSSSPPTHGRSSHSLTTGSAPTQKRWSHKLIEKQRRKDMKMLFSRLRSLLPEENLRGKRAESDQVVGAVNYICDLQQKIKDLSREKDRMNANPDRKQFAFVGVQFSSNDKFCSKRPRVQGSDGEFPTVKINSVRSGVKISINAFEDQIVYSDVLLTLEECGLEVVNATSSSINNRVFHTIHNKVSGIDHFKMDDLYEKLRHLISNNQADLRLP